MELQKIVLPAYTTMQRLIESSNRTERIRLENIIVDHLTESEKESLNSLLSDKYNGFYVFTWLQKYPPNFNTHAMRAHMERQSILAPLYRAACNVISKLGISNENIQYYGTIGYPLQYL